MTTVTVSAADLRTVLDQRHLHAHRRPGIWDSDNPGKGGTRCQECAARERLRSALWSAEER